MDAPTATVISAVLAFLTTSIGWVVVNYLTRTRETRLRRTELALNKTEEQIRQFYGPLFALIQQIWIVNRVEERLLKNLKAKDNSEDLNAVKHRIQVALNRNYYLPLHLEIREILKNRLHLLEGIEPPKSFRDYSKHATMQSIQDFLFASEKIRTDSVKGFPWSFEFPDDVKTGLMKARLRYDGYLKDIRQTS
jgi:hypothetical protein